MTETEFKNIGFYKDLYLFELERGNFYDRLIQYPTTLLIVFIGAALYSFNSYFINSFEELCTKLDWTFAIIFSLFAISTIITIYFLGIMFHGFTRKYEHLPFTGQLEKHEKDLYKYYYKYSEEKTYSERREDAKNLTCKNFTLSIKKYYTQSTQVNQVINDKRANAYYYTRTFLFIDLILLIILGTIGYLQ